MRLRLTGPHLRTSRITGWVGSSTLPRIPIIPIVHSSAAQPIAALPSRGLMPPTTGIPIDPPLAAESSTSSKQTAGVKRKTRHIAVHDPSTATSRRVSRRSLPIADASHGDEPARGEEANLLGYDGTVSVRSSFHGGQTLLPFPAVRVKRIIRAGNLGNMLTTETIQAQCFGPLPHRAWWLTR